MTRLDHQLNALDEEEQEVQPYERKTITFMELEEDEVQAVAESRVIIEEDPVPPTPVREEKVAEPVPPQVVHTVVQAPPVSEAAVQQLTKALGDFSFDAIRSEIDLRFEVLRKDLEKSAALPGKQEEQLEAAVPASTAMFKIETAKIAVPVQETETGAVRPDYSDMIMADDDESDDTDEEVAGGIDIMALLSEQAKRLEDVSPVEMMEMYDEAFAEITLEELEHYINKKR